LAVRVTVPGDDIFLSNVWSMNVSIIHLNRWRVFKK